MATNEGNSPSAHGVVVGVDGSAASREALEWAAREAVLRQLPLEVVTTWGIRTSTATPRHGRPTSTLRPRSKTLDETIQLVLGPRTDTPLSALVVEGHAALVLEELSKSAVLIVVGSRGHGGFAGMLLGSVSEHLAARRHCPVMIVHGSDTSRAQK